MRTLQKQVKLEKSVVWINGVDQQSVCCNDRGLAYGDGLFETMRVVRRGIPLLDYHTRRLSLSLDRLNIQLDFTGLMKEIAAFLLHDSVPADMAESGVIKLIITRGAGGRGYCAPASSLIPARILSWHHLPLHPLSYQRDGIHLYPCSTRLHESEDFAGIKHLCRLDQVMARNEWSNPEFAEGLMLSQRGNPSEGTMTNLFIVCQGKIVTPLLDKEGVHGVMRAWILDKASKYQFDCIKKNICFDDLRNASEIFLCNSINGIWPVLSYKDIFWKVGPVTRKLQTKVQHLFKSHGKIVH